eukprot:UN12408
MFCDVNVQWIGPTSGESKGLSNVKAVFLQIDLSFPRRLR